MCVRIHFKYCLHFGLLVLAIPITVESSLCQEISSQLGTQAPLVAKCREIPQEVQCVTLISNPLPFSQALAYCPCLGSHVRMLDRLDPSFKNFLFTLQPTDEFWVNVRLDVIQDFIDIRGSVYDKPEHIVQNNPRIDHCVAVWPGRETITGDLVRQAHPCFHSDKYFVCRRDGAACSDVTDENRDWCVSFHEVSRVTWYEARRRCIQDGGDLVYLKRDETFSSVLGGKQMAEQVWVGLRRAVWRWGNGSEATEANWSPYQLPAAINATCATVVTSTGAWYAHKCNGTFKVICTEFKTPGSRKDAEKNEDENNYSINYFVIGGILGGIVILLIIVLCCVWMCKCRKSEEKPIKRQNYLTMPADDVFRNPDITAATGHVNPITNNMLRKVPNATQLQISNAVQRDRFGNVRPHSGGFNENRRPLGRSLSHTVTPNRHAAMSVRSVSLEDVSVILPWGDKLTPPIPAISGSQGTIPVSTPLFARKGSNQDNKRGRNISPNNKDRQGRNSKNKINKINNKNAKNGNKSKRRKSPLTPALPSQRAEIILGVQDGRLIDQNKTKNKAKSKRRKRNNPTYVNEVPSVPPRGSHRDSQRPLSEEEGISDYPTDYNSYDRFRY